MPSRLLRLPLLAKILLSTTVAITILFGFTGEIVLSHIRRTMSESLHEEVQNSFRAYTALLSSRADLLSSVSRVLSTMREVRLAFSTGDRATIQDTAGELWSKISDSGAIFLVTDPKGRVLASLGGVTTLSLDKDLDVVPQAAGRFPQQVSGFHLLNGRLYYLTVTPVYVDSTQGPALLNVLVAGYHVDALVAQKLKENTDSEFLFLTPGRVMASTLNPRATEAIVRGIAKDRAAERVSDGVAEYARFETRLTDLTGKPIGEICILRSFEGAQKRINGLYTNILLLWLAAIGAGLRPHLPAGAPHRGAGETARPRRRRSGPAELRHRSAGHQRGRDGPAGAHLQQHVRLHPAGARRPHPPGAHLHHRAPLRLHRARPAQSPGRHLRRRRDAGGWRPAASRT